MDDLLFQEVRIGSMCVKNRFSMGAAIDHMDKEPEGRIKRFAELARGGVGLIVSGATNLADTGTWLRVVEAVHEAGAKFAIQLIADKIPGAFVAPLPKDHPLFTTLVPSLTYTENHRGLTEGEIEGFIEGYAHRAQNAESIGADAIEGTKAVPLACIFNHSTSFQQ
jgi:2,4-dienoyl-CoA reductase-like NADH-dependent reductase (Old Yellow Enzyme family)